MSEWIEEMSKFAENAISGCKGDLEGYGPHVFLSSDQDYIWLDGEFTIDQLQDLVNHMNKYKGK